MSVATVRPSSPTNTRDTTATRATASSNAHPGDQLEMLRNQCQHFIDVINSEMDARA